MPRRGWPTGPGVEIVRTNVDPERGSFVDYKVPPAPSAETFSPKEIALMNEKWLHRKALGLAEAAPSAEPQGEPQWQCCGNPVVGAEYMGAVEMICCGMPVEADEPQPAAPSAEPVAKVVLTETLGLPCLQWLDLDRQFDFKGGELLYTTPPDHTATMQQALSALDDYEVRYCELFAHAGLGDPTTDSVAVTIGRSAIDSLRAALEGKR
jgi:hypothetical protein